MGCRCWWLHVCLPSRWTGFDSPASLGARRVSGAYTPRPVGPPVAAQALASRAGHGGPSYGQLAEFESRVWLCVAAADAAHRLVSGATRLDTELRLHVAIVLVAAHVLGTDGAGVRFTVAARMSLRPRGRAAACHAAGRGFDSRQRLVCVRSSRGSSAGLKSRRVSVRCRGDTPDAGWGNGSPPRFGRGQRTFDPCTCSSMRVGALASPSWF